MSESDVKRLLGEAAKQYEVYLELQNVTSLVEESAVQENYERDFSHPLSIQLKR